MTLEADAYCFSSSWSGVFDASGAPCMSTCTESACLRRLLTPAWQGIKHADKRTPRRQIDSALPLRLICTRRGRATGVTVISRDGGGAGGGARAPPRRGGPRTAAIHHCHPLRAARGLRSSTSKYGWVPACVEDCVLLLARVFYCS